MRARAPLRWRRMVIRLSALCLPVFLLAGCLFPPEPMTTEAEQIRTLFLVIFALGAIVFVGVEGFLVYAAIRYRRRDDRLPAQTHGNTMVEIVWTVIPTIIVLILFVTSMLTLGSISARASDPVTIEVDGYQWYWSFLYDTGYRVTGSPGSAPDLVVPVGEPVRLRLVSDNVIHSFYVPAFLVKKDVIPFGQGQAPNELEFTVTTAGTYSGQCAEFCGQLHADMTFTVVAMERADFDAWLANAGSATPTAAPTTEPTTPADVTTVELTADHVAFDVHELEVPAGKPFVIQFHNLEGVTHNVAIYDGQTTIYTGSAVTGPDATANYSIDALPAGEYTFICTFHPIPEMTGTLTVR